MDKTIHIYSTPTCHFCQMAKDFLKEKGIVYIEFDVAHDLDKRQEMIIGFDRERLASILGITA